MVFLKEPPSVTPLGTNRRGISKAAHEDGEPHGPPVASRRDLADAIQSYNDNDNEEASVMLHSPRVNHFGSGPKPLLVIRLTKGYTSSRDCVPDPLSGARTSSK